MKDMIDNIDRMIELTTQKIALLHELKKALLLSEIIGIPPKEIHGKISFRATDFGPVEFIVEMDGVEVHRRKMADTPTCFWPDWYKNRQRLAQKQNRRTR